MKYNNWVKLVTSIIICEVAGVVGTLFTTPQIGTWYQTIKKPSFNPPNWIFGPVWTTIFVLMGIALYLVWEKNWEPHDLKISKGKPWNKFSKKFYNGNWRKLNIILIFSVQLILNILWSLVFFGMNSPMGGFFVLVMLWFAILFMIINFYRVSKATLWLLLPYILWVSFAGVLNFSIWIIN